MELPVRLAAARALRAVGRRDDAARAVAGALALIARQEGHIPDAALRERFRAGVPENVAVRELGRELGVEA
jgi:hypothetical protein